jgi:hypothetical protein
MRGVIGEVDPLAQRADLLGGKGVQAAGVRGDLPDAGVGDFSGTPGKSVLVEPQGRQKGGPFTAAEMNRRPVGGLRHGSLLFQVTREVLRRMQGRTSPRAAHPS